MSFRVPAKRLLEQGYLTTPQQQPDTSAPPTLEAGAKTAATNALQTDLTAYLMAVLDPKLISTRMTAALSADAKKNPQTSSPVLPGLDWATIARDTVNSPPVKGAMANLVGQFTKGALASSDKLMTKLKPKGTQTTGNANPPIAGQPAQGQPSVPGNIAPAGGPPAGTAP